MIVREKVYSSQIFENDFYKLDNTLRIRPNRLSCLDGFFMLQKIYEESQNKQKHNLQLDINEKIMNEETEK